MISKIRPIYLDTDIELYEDKNNMMFGICLKILQQRKKKKKKEAERKQKEQNFHNF